MCPLTLGTEGKHSPGKALTGSKVELAYRGWTGQELGIVAGSDPDQFLPIPAPRSTQTQSWRYRYWACLSAAFTVRRAAAGVDHFVTYR